MITGLNFLGFYISFYDLFFACGFISLTILNIILAPKFKIKAWKAMAISVLAYAIGVLWMYVLYYIETGSWGGNNVVRLFVWIPVVMYPVAKIVKTSYTKALDIAGIAMLINHGVSHYGCIFAGCCHGYACEWGIYNPSLDYNCFPIQPIEATSALIALFIVLKYLSKHNYDAKGSSYALTLMLFGYTRFIWEFFRDNNETFPGIPSLGISSLQIHAAICAIVGTIWWIIYKNGYKININKKLN